MQKQKSIILLSGGMDSLVTLAIAIDKGYIPYVLHLNYSQNTQEKELKAFNSICNYYSLLEKQRLIINIDYLKKIGGTSLIDVDKFHSCKEENNINVPDSYVPFRNANILAIGTSWAEVIGANAIFIGASQIDYSGYPDCRRVFFDAFENTILYGTKEDTNIKIITPLINMSKEDIVRNGIRLKVLLDYLGVVITVVIMFVANVIVEN